MMTNGKTQRMVLSLAVVLLASAAAMAQTTDGLARTATWQAPSLEEVKTQAFAYLDEQKADDDVKTEAENLWADVPEPAVETELLGRLAATVALVDDRAAALVDLCSQPKDQLILPDQNWLEDETTDPLVSANLRLLYGRWLVHESLFDEAVHQLADLKPTDVVAPASLLFFQGVAHHGLLEKEPGLKAIEQLLDGEDDSPRRYVAVARLMQEDLSGLEDESLDHIARRMGDIRRRLDLGRAGKKVRGVEDGVIEDLDKLIKKIEQQQQQASQSGSGNNIQSSQPAPDSTPMGGKARGDVTKRHIGSEDGWGDLPPKEREEALQQIGRDFPSHYREVIEQYFRRLAAEGSE